MRPVSASWPTHCSPSPTPQSQAAVPDISPVTQTRVPVFPPRSPHPVGAHSFARHALGCYSPWHTSDRVRPVVDTGVEMGKVGRSAIKEGGSYPVSRESASSPRSFLPFPPDRPQGGRCEGQAWRRRCFPGQGVWTVSWEAGSPREEEGKGLGNLLRVRGGVQAR